MDAKGIGQKRKQRRGSKSDMGGCGLVETSGEVGELASSALSFAITLELVGLSQEKKDSHQEA